MKTSIQSCFGKALLLMSFILAQSFINGYAQAPTAIFTSNVQSGCSPIVVNFTDQSTGNPTKWSWDFGNGNTSALQNPTATYFNPGTYTVKLTVSNASGSNTLTRTAFITVDGAPEVNFAASPTAGCYPLPVQFTDLSTAGNGNTNVAWQWDFGNGQTSTLQNPTITYTSADVFSVTLRVTNDKGCSRTFTKRNYITVTNGVDAAFTHTEPTVCKAPAAISFTNTSTGPGTLSYFWLFGDGNTSTLQNPTHTYSTNGTYTAKLVVRSSSGCVDTAVSLPISIGANNTSFTTAGAVCVNEPATFTNTSTPAPSNSTWYFGDGNTTTNIHSTHTYAAPGTYTVKLINTYTNCVDSITQNIIVNPKPVADFTAPVTTRCGAPLTVNFQDASTGGATAWQWDFGDGGTSTQQNPTHTYTAAGSFTVTLTVTNQFGCTNTVTKNDFIQIQRPSISIPQLPTKGCIPYTISPIPVINSIDGIASYEWDFGDGNTSTSATPTHTYTVQGTYTVRLIVTSNSGCRDTLIIPAAVRVGTKPVANFIAGPIPQCAFQPVIFTDQTTSTPPVDEWQWIFGDGGTSTQQNPTYTYSSPGTFDVTLIASNNGCPDTIVRTQYVKILPPVARFSHVVNCQKRTEVQFTDESIEPLTWAWDFGDGNTSTQQSPLHTYAAFGVYTVTLTVTNGDCMHTTTRTVYAVDPDPNIAADRTTACKTALINFTASNITPAHITNYFWQFGDGAQQNTSSPTIAHTYTASGTYSVLLVTTDVNGCRDTVSKINYIRVNGPTALFTANNVAGCAGLTTTFNDASTTDGVNAISNWQWDFGDGTVQTFTAPPFTHTYTTAGRFNVKLIVTDVSGCRDSLTLQSLVNATDPVPAFTASDIQTCPGANVTFTNSSTGSNFTSNWTFGDGGTSNTASPSYIYANSGNYTVQLAIQDEYGCRDTLTKELYIKVDRPKASFTVSDTASYCIPLELKFSSTSTYANSLLWNFGGSGSATINDPVHIYNSPGTFTASLIATSPGGCTDTAYQTITLYDTADYTIRYPRLTGCLPLSATFSASVSGPVNKYVWDFGDGNISSTTTPTVDHQYTTFGSFLPKLIMEVPGGCFILIEGIDTAKIIGAKAKFSLDNQFFCDSGFVQLSDSSTTNDGLLKYNWSFGDGSTSTLQNPLHQFRTPGLHTVSLTVESENGCKDTAYAASPVKIVQSPVVNINGRTSVCINGSLLHSGVFAVADTSVVNWAWTFPNGNTSTLQNPASQTYRQAGTFTVTTIATNSSGCKDTVNQQIIVHPLPTVTMPGTMTIQNGFPTLIPATYSAGVNSWNWTPATGLSCTNCPTPEAGPQFNTNYRVSFTDVNGCSNRGEIQVVTICKDANLFIPNTFSPNGDGSNDIFYPRGRGLFSVKNLRIFNRWGEVVFEKRNFQPNDASAGWDGTYKGRKAQADVYIFQAEVFCDNGETITLNGNISLIL